MFTDSERFAFDTRRHHAFATTGNAYDAVQCDEAINTGENRLLLDVLICDIRMPKINGVEAIAYFQQEWPRVPIIVLTTETSDQMMAAFREAGASGWMSKPYSPDRLDSALKKYFG